MTIDLGGPFGVWRLGNQADAAFAQEVERLGYSTLWLGAVTEDDLGRVGGMLEATSGLIVASGIVNIWTIDPRAAADWFLGLDKTYPGRVVLGVGVGHPEASGQQAATPYDALVTYLDRLAGAGVPAGRIVLAALGPRVLRLARDRTAGAHPYLTTPEHTASARELLGAGKLLIPEQHVALGHDRRADAQAALDFYLQLTNYRNSWLRLGFTPDDLRDGGSDALIDALVATGSPESVAAHLRRHREAGADHVVVQALGDRPLEDLAALAVTLRP